MRHSIQVIGVSDSVIKPRGAQKAGSGGQVVASAPNTKPVHQSQTPRRVSQGNEHACSLLSEGTSIVRSFSAGVVMSWVMGS